MAADLEVFLDADSRLKQSSGGVFEVEYNGTLIYSKKALGRFPCDGEVLEIVQKIDSGIALSEAQKQAAINSPQPISFFDWFKQSVKSGVDKL